MKAPLSVLAVIALTCATESPAPHTPDPVLRERFRKQKAAFEGVAAVFNANPRIGVVDERGLAISSSARVLPGDATIAEPYRSEYRRILQELSVSSVVRRADGTLAFIASEIGTGVDASAKGFEYSPALLQPHVASLDAVQLQCGDIYYSHIEGRWHLYLQSYCS